MGATPPPPAGGVPDDPFGPVEVPDDASELAFEAEALRRERAARRRRERWARRLHTGRWARFGLSGPLVAGVLVLVALVASLGGVLGPRPPARLLPEPLAHRPVGGEGGLLPDVRLEIGAERVPVRVLRPGVLGLVPDGCACPVEAEQVVGQAGSLRLATYLVATPASADDLAELRASRRVRPEGTAVDGAGALAAGYAADPRRLTLLFVRSDGVVVQVVRGFTEGQRLEPDLARLARASGLDLD